MRKRIFQDYRILQITVVMTMEEIQEVGEEKIFLLQVFRMQ